MAIDVGDESRRLYEQIGTLYEGAAKADTLDRETSGLDLGGDEDGTAVQQLADFLDTVYQAATGAPGPRARALCVAIRRYEADRTGGRS